jgi:hypothetical protein
MEARLEWGPAGRGLRCTSTLLNSRDQNEPGRSPDMRRRGFAVLSVRFVCAGDRTPAGVCEGLCATIDPYDRTIAGGKTRL